jgi:type II secretory pathway component GspD/PulD (secretin)
MVMAQDGDVISGDVRITVIPTPWEKAVNLKGVNKRVTLSFRDMSIGDAIRALARKAGFNVVIHESVESTFTVDLNDVTIQDALETIKTYGKLAYSVRDNTLLVAGVASEPGQVFLNTASRIIPLKYANARTVAGLLNQTLFAAKNAVAQAGNGAGGAGGGGGGAGQNQSVNFDGRTNSIIVVGTPAEMETVDEYIQALDIPRESKTWRLSHSNAVDVATILASTLYNDGVQSFVIGGGGGGGAGAAGQTLSSSTLRVRTETLQEGTGAAGGGGGGAAGGGTQSYTLRGTQAQDTTASISPQGAIILPDSRLNTITILGTPDQIAMAEAIMPTLDRKLPQVVLETMLIEIQNIDQKFLGSSLATAQQGQGFSYNNGHQTGARLGGVANPFNAPTGIPTNADEFIYQITSKADSFLRMGTPEVTMQLNALIQNRRAKVLSKPYVITESDRDAVVSIVDEVVRSVTVTQPNLGAAPTATTNIGEVGIILNMLPKASPDGTIQLRVRPTVSNVAQTTTDAFGNVVTLLTRREVNSQAVTIREGESFLIGGLIQNRVNTAISKVPGLGDLPIIGAMARNQQNNKTRSELIVVVTPHIIDDNPVAMAGYSKGFTLPANANEPLGKDRQYKTLNRPVAVPGKGIMESSQGRINPSVKGRNEKYLPEDPDPKASGPYTINRHQDIQGNKRDFLPPLQATPVMTQYSPRGQSAVTSQPSGSAFSEVDGTSTTPDAGRFQSVPMDTGYSGGEAAPIPAYLPNDKQTRFKSYVPPVQPSSSRENVTSLNPIPPKSASPRRILNLPETEFVGKPSYAQMAKAGNTDQALNDVIRRFRE